MRDPSVWFLLGALAGCVAVCASGTAKAATGFVLTSTAFGHGERIPAAFTCEGKDQSPALTWSGAPEGTRSFALICDDPDAPVGTWVHWVLYNIPSAQAHLNQGVPTDAALSDGSMNGLNSWRKTGYGGPCPPPGNPHRYFFALYALDTVLGIKPGASQAEVTLAMKGHILAKAELMGLFGR